MTNTATPVTARPHIGADADGGKQRTDRDGDPVRDNGRAGVVKRTCGIEAVNGQVPGHRGCPRAAEPGLPRSQALPVTPSERSSPRRTARS
jgi:hypothetical protein